MNWLFERVASVITKADRGVLGVGRRVEGLRRRKVRGGGSRGGVVFGEWAIILSMSRDNKNWTEQVVAFLFRKMMPSAS